MRADAYAIWNVEAQRWEVADVMDDGHSCEDCGDHRDIEPRQTGDMTAPNAPMSAEEVLAVMDAAARHIPSMRPAALRVARTAVAAMAERHAATERDACLQAERANELASRLAAMAEREAALVARVAELEESFARAGLNAREAQTKAHEATIALGTAKAEIARLELVQVPALVKEVEALRATLERIAKQGPNYGPDGTRETWKHWAVIAQEAIDDARAEARDG